MVLSLPDATQWPLKQVGFKSKNSLAGFSLEIDRLNTRYFNESVIKVFKQNRFYYYYKALLIKIHFIYRVLCCDNSRLLVHFILLITRLLATWEKT